jgi:primosomal replication protein N
VGRSQPESADAANPLEAPRIEPNQVQLGGEVTAREPLRYSPAGVPILALELIHRSRQSEGGVPRQVDLEIELVAIGGVAVKLDAVLPGQRLTARGFLANRSRRSRRVVLHVNEFEID